MGSLGAAGSGLQQSLKKLVQHESLFLLCAALFWLLFVTASIDACAGAGAVDADASLPFNSLYDVTVVDRI